MSRGKLPAPPTVPRIDSLPPGDREWLVSVIQGVERRLGAKLEEQDARISKVESIHVTIESLASDVRAVLRSDAQQESRLSCVEVRMVEASRAAGQKAGLSAGAVGTAIAAAVIAIAQYLAQANPPPITPPRSPEVQTGKE